MANICRRWLVRGGVRERSFGLVELQLSVYEKFSGLIGLVRLFLVVLANSRLTRRLIKGGVLIFDMWWVHISGFGRVWIPCARLRTIYYARP